MAHVLTLTIPTTAVSESHIDFPVLFAPESDAVNADYSDFWSTVANGGGDIRCYESGGTATEFPREVVDLDKTAKTGEIWFKRDVSILSDSVTDIYADGTSSDYAVTATYGRNAVWGDYIAVLHEGSGTDSAGNHDGIVDSGSPTTTTTDHPYDGSWTDFDGIADRIRIPTGSDFNGKDITVQAIFRWDGAGGSDDMGVIASLTVGPPNPGIFRVVMSSFGVRGSIDDGNEQINYRDVVADNAETTYWTTLTSDSSNLSLYIEGSLSGSVAGLSGGQFTNSADTYVGAYADLSSKRSFGGKIGGVRLRGDATNPLSADWITDEYANQSSPSTWYTVTAVGGGTTVAAATYAASLGATMSAEVTALASAAYGAQVSVSTATILAVQASISPGVSVGTTATGAAAAEAAVSHAVASGASATGQVAGAALVDAVVTFGLQLTAGAQAEATALASIAAQSILGAAATTGSSIDASAAIGASVGATATANTVIPASISAGASLSAAADAQAQADAAATLSLSLATQALAEALAQAGITAATIQGVTITGSTIAGDAVTPDGRIYRVTADTRVFHVSIEDRTYTVH